MGPGDRRPARVLGLARVSGREQGEHGTSLDGQRDFLVRYCAERDYPKPQIFTEIESGGEEKTEKREELARLQAEARPGDLILVTLVDRWSRDLVFGVSSVRALVRRGIGWRSIGEGIDASTPEGDDRLGLMSWVADQERKRIRRRTVGRRQELRDQGLYVEGPAPFGLRRGAREQRRQLHLEIVESEAPLVREAFERCAHGESIGLLVEWLEVETGRTWDKKSVHKLLRNRVYLGEVRDSRGTWIPATHPALLSRDLFERAQAAMASRRLGGRRPEAESRTASWLLRGLATCPACGGRVGASYGRSADYYVCAHRLRGHGCAADYVRVLAADAEVNALALARLRELRQELGRPSAPAAGPRRVIDFEARRATIRASRERVIRLATDGRIGDEDLIRELARLDAAIGKLELAAGAAAREISAASPAARAAALVDVRTLERAWTGAPVDVRREALRQLARAIVLRPEGATIVWRTAEELASERTDQP